MRSFLTVNNKPPRLYKSRKYSLILMLAFASLQLMARGESDHSLGGLYFSPFSLDHSFDFGYSFNNPSNMSSALDCEKSIDVEIFQTSHSITLTDLLGTTPADPSDYYYYLQGKGGFRVYCKDVGKKLLVILRQHSTGESCSIWVNVKDGGKPTISCNSVTVHCQESLDDLTISYSDNCTPKDLLRAGYVDEKQEGVDCSNYNASTVIHRLWTVWDRAGNSNTCIQVISISRPPMSAVEIPKDVVLECPDNNTNPSITGVPTINGKPFDHLCGVIVSYKDFVKPGCGKSASIWRTWKITDCCTWVVKEKVQRIEIVDTKPPVLTCPEDITLGTNRNSKGKFYTIPSISIVDECHDEIKVEVNIDDFITIDPGKKINLAKGDHIITYKATDPCGNMSSCSYKVTIEDQDPPVLGCEDITVEVSFDDILEICVADLENYIATDNCGPIDIMIRKNQDFCEDDEDDLEFDDCVHFCCEDGTSAYVTIKATDGAGNVSFCRFNVMVIGPPGDLEITIDSIKNIACDQPIIFDEPEVTSVCAAEVKFACDTLEDRRDDCGLGIFTKRFIATNVLNGDKDTAIQTVTIFNPRPFGIENIVCPPNISVEGCTEEDAGDLGDIRFTRLPNVACFDIDTVFSETRRSAPDSCIIITRTWEITDKCQPDSSWTCIQVIVINDSQSPVLSGASDTTVSANRNCRARVVVGPVTATDCDTTVTITNSINATNTVNGVFRVGETTVEFYGEDDCGNVDTLRITVTVEDDTPPTLVCADTTIDCGSIIPETTPTVNDNCFVDSVRLISETNSLDDCGQGTITRVYRAWDSSQNTATCTSTITIEGNGLFNEDDINWPRTPIISYECTTPGMVDGGSTTVDTAGLPCVNVSITSADSLGGGNGEFCTTIYRTWTVFDSCSMQQWDSIQVIGVVDTVAPILSGPRDITVYANDTCSAEVTLDTVVAEDCDPNVVITNNMGGGAVFTGTFDLGMDSVIFNGLDSCGNMGSLTIKVTVLDTTPPTIICRADRTIACGDPIPRIFARPSDNCPGGRLIVDTVRINMPCDLDTILLISTIIDASGNISPQCTTKVTYSTPPFDCDLITLERDTIDISDCEASLDPDSIEMSRPFIPNFGDCHGFKIFFSDSIFSDGLGASCNVMITRIWKIVDTCTAAPHDTCVKIQLIRIADTTAPQLITPPDTCHFASATDRMVSFIDLPPAFARDCDPMVSITNDFNDQGADIADNFPLGVTQIIYTATDICENFVMDTTLVEIKDTIPVSFICQKLFRHVSDEAVPIVVVKAHEFVTSVSNNNFTDSVDLKFSFSESVDDTTMTFGCESLGVLPLTVFVTDLSGNQDTCRPLIRILDTINGGFCPQLNGIIAGSVGTENNIMLEDVQVNSSNKSVMTNLDGHFVMDKLAIGSQYRLTPEKGDNNFFNGVTSLDLLAIQKHILGIEPLKSPYAMIAADINRSGDITTLDVALLQLAILGRVQEDVDLGWRFVDKQFDFPLKSNPWYTVFPEYIDYDPLGQNEMESDFVAIKLGDVNNSAVAQNASEAGLRNKVDITMTTPERLVSKGELVEVAFRLSQEATLEAMQFTLEYNNKYLTVESIDNEIFETELDAIAGKIKNSWIYARGAQFDSSNDLLKVTFIAQEKGMLSHLIGIDSQSPAEVFVVNQGAGTVNLGFGESASEEFILYQNRPNPFTEQTQIQFYIPHETKADLKVYDASGKVLFEESKQYSKGLHNVELRLNDLTVGGMLYYQLETAEYVATKKMIVLK